MFHSWFIHDTKLTKQQEWAYTVIHTSTPNKYFLASNDGHVSFPDISLWNQTFWARSNDNVAHFPSPRHNWESNCFIDGWCRAILHPSTTFSWVSRDIKSLCLLLGKTALGALYQTCLVFNAILLPAWAGMKWFLIVITPEATAPIPDLMQLTRAWMMWVKIQLFPESGQVTLGFPKPCAGQYEFLTIHATHIKYSPLESCFCTSETTSLDPTIKIFNLVVTVFRTSSQVCIFDQLKCKHTS